MRSTFASRDDVAATSADVVRYQREEHRPAFNRLGSDEPDVGAAPGRGSAACAVPPCARAIASTIASPSPVPPPRARASARLKRSNAMREEVGREPAPSSETLQLERRRSRARASMPHRARSVPERVVDEVSERLLEPAVDRPSSARSVGRGDARSRVPPMPRASLEAAARRQRAGRATSAAPRGSPDRPRPHARAREDPRRARTSRSTSSAAERRAASSSSGVRGRRSASSSSVCRVASGVRSSWLASATKRRSRARPASSRSSISFSVSPRRRDLVVRRAEAGAVARASPTEISAASRRIASTGRSAAPATR